MTGRIVSRLGVLLLHEFHRDIHVVLASSRSMRIINCKITCWRRSLGHDYYASIRSLLICLFLVIRNHGLSYATRIFSREKLSAGGLLFIAATHASEATMSEIKIMRKITVHARAKVHLRESGDLNPPRQTGFCDRFFQRSQNSFSPRVTRCARVNERGDEDAGILCVCYQMQREIRARWSASFWAWLNCPSCYVSSGTIIVLVARNAVNGVITTDRPAKRRMPCRAYDLLCLPRRQDNTNKWKKRNREDKPRSPWNDAD